MFNPMLLDRHKLLPTWSHVSLNLLQPRVYERRVAQMAHMHKYNNNIWVVILYNKLQYYYWSSFSCNVINMIDVNNEY